MRNSNNKIKSACVNDIHLEQGTSWFTGRSYCIAQTGVFIKNLQNANILLQITLISSPPLLIIITYYMHAVQSSQYFPQIQSESKEHHLYTNLIMATYKTNSI